MNEIREGYEWRDMCGHHVRKLVAWLIIHPTAAAATTTVR